MCLLKLCVHCVQASCVCAFMHVCLGLDLHAVIGRAEMCRQYKVYERVYCIYIYVCVHVFACVCVEEWVAGKKFLVSFYIGLHMVVHVKASANMQLVFVQKVVTIIKIHSLCSIIW